MSWDVDLLIDTGKGLTHFKEVRNVTWNNSAIFHALGVHPGQVQHDGNMKTCEEWAPLLRNAIVEAAKPEKFDHLRTLEPPNKWGGIQNSLEIIQELLVLCEEHPKAIVSWS